MEVVTRKEAKALGLKRYFNGVPCPKGHLAERTFKKSTCVECSNTYYRDNRDRVLVARRINSSKIEFKEKKKAADKVYYEANKEKVNEKKKEYKQRRKEFFTEHNKKYYETNKDKIKVRSKIYYEEKKIDYFIRASQRRACKRRASVFHDIHKEEIKLIYKKCAYVSEVTGILHSVDHIVPLKHKLVSGLHVPANLRIIPAYENLSKYNKFEIL